MSLGATKGRWRGLTWLAIVAPLLMGAALALFFFAPDQYAFYPRCWLYTITGWQCPGCGGLRAAHQLLHGHLAAAFRCNPLLVALVPMMALWALSRILRRATGREVCGFVRHPVFAWAVLAGLVAFAVLRNVPFERLAGPIW